MKFDGRIIIPIFNLDGELVSFQGRDIMGTAEKKYLFPPGFAVTGKHLFNGHNVVASSRVVLGEGAFDVMALKIALDEDESLRNVTPIGSFGKHLSEDQMTRFAELKERGVKEVCFMWDSEVGAIDAAIVAGTELKRRYGLEVKIAILPKGKDPNECSTEDVRNAYYGALLLTKENAVRLKLAQRNL
jgi:DNA primase